MMIDDCFANQKVYFSIMHSYYLCLCEKTQQLRITNIDHRRSEGAESKDHGNDQDFLVLAKGQEIQMMCVQYAANIL